MESNSFPRDSSFEPLQTYRPTHRPNYVVWSVSYEYDVLYGRVVSMLQVEYVQLYCTCTCTEYRSLIVRVDHSEYCTVQCTVLAILYIQY